MPGRVRTGVRPDARRNRERLVAAALTAFTADGAGTSLEGIARDAGVGIGTLYRHFPSREALIEAVYRSELDQVCAAAGPLLARHPADRALRLWMGRYADFVTRKRGMAEALRTVIAAGRVTSSQTRAQLGAAAQALLLAGADSGVLRADVAPEDVVAAMAGAASAASSRAQVGRLLDLLVAGIAATPGSQQTR